jgi:3-hydroxybutyryl-CoA dehydrogenase
VEERVAIAGSGAIACGLAAVVAARGDVLLLARSPDSAKRAAAKLDGLAERLGADGTIRVSTDPGDLVDTSFVVEAIVEDHETKASLLEELSQAAPPEAILATTTSSLVIDLLARASGRPDRFVGLHVFNPVPKMDLVELAFPTSASEETRSRARALCEALGKTAVEVPDTPGFVVNRLLFPYLFDAVEVLEETGLEPEAIDRCMTLGAGHPMGPLELLDFVGLDVAAAIGESIGVNVPERIRALVEAGALGKKSGRGFYEY